jgi:hypothetical protein
MFEQVYLTSRLIERHRQAPLRSEREQYLRHLIEQGYSYNALLGAATFMLHIIRVLGLSELRVVHEDEIERGANIWAEYRGPFRDCRHLHYGSPKCFMKFARSWLRFHDKLALPSDVPFQEQLQMFSNALRFHQGLAATTIRGYSNRVRLFLKWLAARGGELGTVSMIDIDEFLAEKRAEGWKPRGMASQCNALRGFLRFAETQGWCVSALLLQFCLRR